MLVKFTGNGELSGDYNGKRYHFSRVEGVKDIPAIVYDYFKGAKTVESSYLVPVEAVGQKDLEDKIEALRQDNIRLVKENKDLLGRIEHLQKQNIKERKEKKK